MDDNVMGIHNFEMNQLFSGETNQFLNDIPEKVIKTNDEINKLEGNKEVIIKKIVEKSINDNPRDRREYTNNSESALESINIISKNLHDLSSNYNTIKSQQEAISRRYKEGISDFTISEDTRLLTEKIRNVEELERKIEEDNKKNYLIIKRFFENNDEEPEKENVDLKDINLEDVTLENLTNRPILKICEKRVELPYTKKEIEEFMREYPNDYKTPQDVISKEFITHISVYKRHPVFSRFKETYYLCRTKEMMNIFDSFNYAKSIMFRADINPYIIAAVKNLKQLEDYIVCMENNRLEEYRYFKIIYDVKPTKSHLK